MTKSALATPRFCAAILAATSLFAAALLAAAPLVCAEENPRQARIAAAMRAAFDWQIAHRTTAKAANADGGPRGWVHGAFLTGVMEAWRATGDHAYLDYAWKTAGENAWRLGPRFEHGDDHIIAQTYLELAEIDRARADLKPVIETFDRLLAQKHAGAKLLWWCDSLYMQPQVWARLAKITGDPKYLAEMDRLYWESVDYLYDKEERLFFRDKGYMPHDKDFQPVRVKNGRADRFQERNGQKMFWSRGNGWVFAGLPRIMDYIPENDPRRARYETLFKQMAARILELQPADGLWRMGLLDPAAHGHGEVSGSAFFIYGLAWGVRHGLLDAATYRPAIERGWRALRACQQPDGMVGYVQPIGAAPGRHSERTSQEYGTGGFLLAGSEIYKLNADGIAAPAAKPAPEAVAQRAYQVSVLTRIIGPMLAAAAEGNLKEKLPKIDTPRDRFAPLEALGRGLAGAAPWLELGPGDDAEGALRARHIDLAVRAIRHSTNPKSPARVLFDERGQPLVDTAFLAQALLRAPTQLWGNLDTPTRANVIEALKTSRKTKPFKNNWELFSATVEAALLKFTGECKIEVIETAVNDHNTWYKGDGTYGDGARFHWDYYNSFVIQPMLWEVLEVCAEKNLPIAKHLPEIQKRARRYAVVQEMMISPEGTFPIIGRSSTYRFGALQTLSLVALRDQLPPTLAPGGVRAALTAVIKRMIEAPGTFDENGWLRRGVAGHQPQMAESYINNGSVYLCAFGLLQLGLPPDDPFWTEPARPWTQHRLWSGEDLPADHAM
jgi:rhamnogalacturonyl hydrolase YesR